MGYQKPKKDHPWYSGFNRPVKAEDPHKKPVGVFIKELASNWDHMEIITTSYGEDGRHIMGTLPQSKQAAWLIGLLKRNYEQIKI